MGPCSFNAGRRRSLTRLRGLRLQVVHQSPLLRAVLVMLVLASPPSPPPRPMPILHTSVRASA